MFRVLEPHEDVIPGDRMVDYQALKDEGVVQMSQIFNLVFGVSSLDTGKAGKL
jgi:hypothetical protein